MTDALVPPAAGPLPSPSASLAAQLQAGVLAVEGVSSTYPSQPLWKAFAADAVAAVMKDAAPHVDIAAAGDGFRVSVRIGVGPDHHAPEVGRAVAGAIRRHLAPHPAEVQVSIVKIDA